MLWTLSTKIEYELFSRNQKCDGTKKKPKRTTISNEQKDRTRLHNRKGHKLVGGKKKPNSNNIQNIIVNMMKYIYI